MQDSEIFAFPTQSFQNFSYYRDVVFSAAVTNPNNNLGGIAVNGTAAADQTP